MTIVYVVLGNDVSDSVVIGSVLLCGVSLLGAVWVSVAGTGSAGRGTD